jgi:large subunit ribosomal protein L21
MKYAVIRTGGKQYRVAPGDIIRVERLPGDVGSAVEFSDVLLATDDSDVQVGTPLVSGLRVQAEIVAQARSKKIVVFKKKRRKDYRRTRGHRQNLTSVRVTGIAPTQGVDAHGAEAAGGSPSDAAGAAGGSS